MTSTSHYSSVPCPPPSPSRGQLQRLPPLPGSLLCCDTTLAPASSAAALPLPPITFRGPVEPCLAARHLFRLALLLLSCRRLFSLRLSLAPPSSFFRPSRCVCAMERFSSQASLSEKEAFLADAMSEFQLKEMQSMFNGLGQRCFNRCVHSFRSRHLDQSERQCVGVCVEKWMAHMQRVGARFAEETQAGGGGGGGGGGQATQGTGQ